jgi:transcriptional regulator with XRE-family HTH domain
VKIVEELKVTIAANIASLRKAREMTQFELAERLYYSDKAVSKWERGESIPDVAVLKQIADLFSVTVYYLLTDDHSDKREQPGIISQRNRINELFSNIKIINAMSSAREPSTCITFINLHICLNTP